MLRICFLIGTIVGLSSPAFAQYYDKTYSLSWDINAPLSNTDYVDKISSRGFKLGYREMINERIFAGIDFSNTTFTKNKPRKTYTNAANSITTDFFNYTYYYGLALSGEYYFKIERRIMPFAGFGIGASYIKYKQFYNVYANQSDSWGVLVRPHAGIQFRIKDDSKWALQTSLHYDYSSAKNKDFDLGTFHNIGIQVGVVFLTW